MPRRRSNEREDDSSPAGRLAVAVGIAKNIVEIIAIIAAGWWAYTRFFAAEAPSLEERALVESALAWIPDDDERCIATFGISVKNVGKRSFDIEEITLRAWVVPRPEPPAGVSRLDPESLMEARPQFVTTFGSGSITGHYAPDTTLHDDYVFVVPHRRGDPQRLALFRFTAKAHASGNAAIPVAVDDFRWTPVCEQEVEIVTSRESRQVSKAQSRKGSESQRPSDHPL